MSSTKLQTGWHNWSQSIRDSTILVYKPENEEELVLFVKKNNFKSTPHCLRPFSAGHAYASVMISPNTSHRNEMLIDLTNLNRLVKITDTTVVVETAMKLNELLQALESRAKTLENMTGCLDLSVGGCFLAASHGSGYMATIADLVRSVRVLKSNGEILNVPRSDSNFALLAGSMGACAIVLNVEFDIVPSAIYKDILINFSTPHELVEQVNRDDAYRGQPGDATQFFWIPVTNQFVYIQRRKAPHNTEPRNYQSLIGKFSDEFEGIAASMMDSLRVHQWTSAKRTFTLIYLAFRASLSQLPNVNTLYQLALPVSNEVEGLRPSFEVGEDCELFFPVSKLVHVIDLYNSLFNFILSPDYIWETDPSFLMIQKHGFVSRLKDCVHVKALFSSPVLVRFVPRNETITMAPNYKQDVFAFSFAWFGRTSEMVHYTKAMDLFIDIGVLEFGAKVHLGKYHNPQCLDMYASQAPATRSLVEQWDPKHILQNQFTRNLFSLNRT